MDYQSTNDSICHLSNYNPKYCNSSFIREGGKNGTTLSDTFRTSELVAWTNAVHFPCDSIHYCVNHGSLGALVTFLLVAAGVVTTSLDSKIRWAFPMANMISWIHYTELFKKPSYPIWASYLYFAVAILLLLTANIRALKNYQLTDT